MIVCADDYGLRREIDDAILELCRLGRLSAVSCMVAFQRCDAAVLAPLLAHQAKLDIGLHLCLTDENLALSAAPRERNLPEFKTFLRRALLGKLDPEEISGVIASQYELFLKKCARPPDHIDGHLHVHQLPGVRAALVDFLGRLPPDQRPYIRNTRMDGRELRRRRLPWTKAVFIGAWGRQMRRLLEVRQLRTNNGFAGIYDFRDWREYPELLPRFVECLSGPNGLLVVHPGLKQDWRRQEFECLRDFAGLEKRINRFQK